MAFYIPPRATRKTRTGQLLPGRPFAGAGTGHCTAMDLVVTGATGNIGDALLRLLAAQDGADSIRGVTSRTPPGTVAPYDQVRWAVCDLRSSDSVAPLTAIMQRATAVVHLAWDIVGADGRDEQVRTNVAGTGHVLTAIARAGVPHLVYVSSVAAYAPERHRRHRVSERWPLGGIRGSAYSGDKVAVERLLDNAQSAYPTLRVTRLRPPAVLQPAAAGELTRYLLGRLAPLARYRWLRPPVLPIPELTIQVVHAADVADLILRVLRRGAGGAFNVASEPLLRDVDVADALGGRRVPLPGPVLRTAMEVSAAVRLQPLDGSWWDMLTRAPLVSTRKARDELGWRPAHHAGHTLAEVRRAALAGVGAGSPRLSPL